MSDAYLCAEDSQYAYAIVELLRRLPGMETIRISGRDPHMEHVISADGEHTMRPSKAKHTEDTVTMHMLRAEAPGTDDVLSFSTMPVRSVSPACVLCGAMRYYGADSDTIRSLGLNESQVDAMTRAVADADSAQLYIDRVLSVYVPDRHTFTDTGRLSMLIRLLLRPGDELVIEMQEHKPALHGLRATVMLRLLGIGECTYTAYIPYAHSDCPGVPLVGIPEAAAEKLAPAPKTAFRLLTGG